MVRPLPEVRYFFLSYFNLSSDTFSYSVARGWIPFLTFGHTMAWVHTHFFVNRSLREDNLSYFWTFYGHRSNIFSYFCLTTAWGQKNSDTFLIFAILWPRSIFLFCGCRSDTFIQVWSREVLYLFLRFLLQCSDSDTFYHLWKKIL